MNIFKKEEKLELQRHMDEIISFSKDKIVEKYGSTFTEDQLKMIQNYSINQEFLLDSATQFLEELQELELYESIYPIQINSSSRVSISYDFIKNRKTFSEYYLTRGIYELFYSILPIEKKSSDLFENYFIGQLKKGVAEFYTREFCLDNALKKEFFDTYHYPLPSLFSIRLEDYQALIENINQELKEKKEVLFQTNYHDLLQEFPSIKKEYLSVLKQELLISPKEEKDHTLV